MKILIKILFGISLCIAPVSTIISCSSPDNIPAEKYNTFIIFREEIKIFLEENVFENIDDMSNKVKEFQNNFSKKYSMTFYDKLNLPIQVSQYDLYFKLEYDNNFLEINKKKITFNLANSYSGVITNDLVVTEEAEVNFNISSNVFSIENENLTIENNGEKNALNLKGVKNYKNLNILFSPDPSTEETNRPLNFRNKLSGTLHGYFKIEWLNNDLYITGYNNEIPTKYTQMFIWEETNTSVSWITINLNSLSTAEDLNISLYKEKMNYSKCDSNNYICTFNNNENLFFKVKDYIPENNEVKQFELWKQEINSTLFWSFKEFKINEYQEGNDFIIEIIVPNESGNFTLVPVNDLNLKTHEFVFTFN